MYNGNKFQSVLIDLNVDDKDSIENVYTEKDSKLTIGEVEIEIM